MTQPFLRSDYLDELARLGVETADADKYKTKILREEGLIDQPKVFIQNYNWKIRIGVMSA